MSSSNFKIYFVFLKKDLLMRFLGSLDTDSNLNFKNISGEHLTRITYILSVIKKCTVFRSFNFNVL